MLASESLAVDDDQSLVAFAVEHSASDDAGYDSGAGAGICVQARDFAPTGARAASCHRPSLGATPYAYLDIPKNEGGQRFL